MPPPSDNFRSAQRQTPPSLTRFRPLPSIPLLLFIFATLAAPTWADSQAAEQSLIEAEEHLAKSDYRAAVKAFKKAEKLADAPVFRCSLGLALAFNQLGAHKEAIRRADTAIDLAPSDFDRARAHNQRGRALLEGQRDNDPAQLEQAAQAFRRTLDFDQSSPVVYFNLGLVLLKLGRDSEGIAELETFLAQKPRGREEELARALVHNPRRARVPLIPDFESATLAGEYLTSEDLLGKVVLIDFWGTWCPPCVASIPELKRLNKRFADSPFVFVSINSGDEESTLRAFVAERGMTWPQISDQDRRLTGSVFQVRKFPTHLVVDHQGVVVYRSSGWGSRSAADLSRQIGVAVRKAKRAL